MNALDKLRERLNAPTAQDAIVALMRMDRDRASNLAWARELCEHFGFDVAQMQRIAYPPKPIENNPALGFSACDA